MKISFKVALVGVILAGLAVGAGFAAYQSGSKEVAPVVKAAGGTAATAAQFGGQSALGAAGRATIGRVARVGEKEFAVRESSSSSPVTVRVDDQTSIRKQVAGTLSDLKPGERISFRGDRAADGSISATSIQIVPAGGAMAQPQMMVRTQSGDQQSQSGGQQRSQGAQPGGQQRGSGSKAEAKADSRDSASGGQEISMGTVDGVAGNVVTVTGGASSPPNENATVKLTVSDNTAITKTTTGDVKDIAEGASVMVTGPKGADGVIVASSVQIMPQDTSQNRRRP